MIYQLSPDKPQVFKNLINDLGNLHPDKNWVVEIKEGDVTRSKAQNRYFHDLLDILLDYMGEEKTEQNKRRFKRRLAHSVDIMEEYDPAGEPKQLVPKATSDMTVSEMTDMIDALKEVLLRMGLTYPLPAHYEDTYGYKP